jgi:hypothetical protein
MTVEVTPTQPKPAPKPAAPKVGDRVQFATYHDTPLIWRITALTKSNITLVSDQVLVAGTYRYDYETAPDTTYATSDPRQWLVNTLTPALVGSVPQNDPALQPANPLGDLATLPTAADLKGLLTLIAAPHPWATTNPGYNNLPLYTSATAANYWLADGRLITISGETTTPDPDYLSAGIRPVIKLDPTKLELRPETPGLFIASPK